jgi:quercetin dioxygenase-like cupin family protein
MKIIHYPEATPKKFDSYAMKNVTGRIVIGKREGAENFYLRVFEVQSGGFTPKHTHDWEHEVFIHRGKGEVLSEGSWHPVNTGDAIFIPANEEHQLRNNGPEDLIFLCLIPAKAPEL